MRTDSTLSALPLNSGPESFPRPRESRRFGLFLKRSLDLAVSALLLALFSPLLLVSSLVVLAALGTPLFFRQRRPGLKGKPFWLYKFRTMKRGELPDDQR